MLISFDEIIEVTLHHEGGYVHDPKDLGGETNFGIAKRFYPDVDIKNLTEEKATDIYRADYWDKNRVEELPEQLRHVFFDMCVNQGYGTAVKILQRACNAKGADIAVDGAEVKDYLMDIEMFDVDQFPTASFQATKCSLQSVNSFTAEGSLTIRNQTHPLAFPFTLDIEMNDGQPRFHLTSEVTVKRLEFGVGQGYWANTSTIPNDVTIQVDVYAGQ